MGLLVAGISWLWNRLSLEDVSYERHIPDRRVFIGEEVSFSVTLTNKKPVPLGRIAVDDELPSAIVLHDAPVQASALSESQVLRHTTSMAWYERIRWDYRITCTKRGFYRLGPTRIASGDLFGFFNSECKEEAKEYLLVYPKVVPLPELGLPPAKPLGEALGGIRIHQDLTRPYGVRDYESGDPLRFVDWKASAKAQHLQVRTFEPSSATTVVVALAVETSDLYQYRFSTEILERSVTVAASVASYAAEQRYNLGLFANGTPALADRPLRIAPNRSPDQLTIILEALATIKPMAIGPMAAHLAEHSRRFPFGATVVIVAAVVSPELAAVLGDLKARGFGVLVLHVGDPPCPAVPDGISVHEVKAHLVNLELADAFDPR